MTNYFSFLENESEKPDYFSAIEPETQKEQKLSFLKRVGKTAAIQPQIAFETAKKSPELSRQLITGLIKGATLESAKPEFEKAPENEAEAYAQEMGRLIGLSGPISIIGKMFSPLGIFGRIIGSAFTGGAIKAGQDYFGKEEFNPTEIAKEAAIWGGIESALVGGQVINQFRKMVNYISRQSGKSKPEVLKFLKDRAAKKFKKSPIDPNTVEVEPKFSEEVFKTTEEVYKKPSIAKEVVKEEILPALRDDELIEAIGSLRQIGTQLNELEKLISKTNDPKELKELKNQKNALEKNAYELSIRRTKKEILDLEQALKDTKRRIKNSENEIENLKKVPRIRIEDGKEIIDDRILDEQAGLRLAKEDIKEITQEINDSKVYLKELEDKYSKINPAFKKEIQKPIEPIKELPPLAESPFEKSLDESISFEATTRPKPKEKPSFRTAVIDELYPIQKYVKSANVGNIPILEDPYKMARLHKGWSGKATTFLHPKGHTFDPITLEKTGKSFGSIIGKHSNELKDFSKYLVAKRAIELSRRGITTGIDLNESNKYIKDNAKKFEKSSSELKQYNKDLLNYAEKSGLLSNELKKTFEELNKDYTPFKRVIEDTPDEYFGRTMQPKKVFHQMKGSTKQIIDPLESIIDNTYLIIRAADQNQVLKSLVDFDEKHRGIGKFIEVTDEKTGKETLKNFFEYLNGEDVIRDDTIKFFDNGKLKTYKVPKDIAEALKGMKPKEFSFVNKALSFPTRLVRLKAITLSPTKLLKLAGVDQLEAFLYTNVGYIPYFHMAKGLFHALGKTNLYFDWLKSGGDQALIRNLSREIKQDKLQNIAKLNRFKNTFNSMESLVRSLEEVSRPLEESTRLAVFELARKKKIDMREAALMSREATLDFMVKGAKTRILNQAIPFFNSAIQGADKFFREMHKNPNLWLKAISLVTIPTLMLWLDNKDNKKYQELPEWEKNAFWHFFAGDIHLRMPKPYELGMLFGTIPERIASYLNDKDPKHIEKAIHEFYEVITPSFIPSIMQPFIESFANRNLFTEIPIIPKRLERLPPEQQYFPYTSETAKKLGKMISKIPNVGETKVASPIMIDRWVSFWTAGIGTNAINQSEKALRKIGILPPKIEPSKEFSDYPILKSFLGKKNYTKQASSINRFYEESDKLEKINNQIKLLKKQNKSKEAQEISKKFNEVKFNQSKKIRRGLAKSHQMINNILEDNQNYTSEEKTILINEIIEQMVNVSRGFFDKD